MIRYTGNTGGCVSAMPREYPGSARAPCSAQASHCARRAVRSGRRRSRTAAIRANPSLAAAERTRYPRNPVTTCARRTQAARQIQTNPGRLRKPNKPDGCRMRAGRRSPPNEPKATKKGVRDLLPARPRGKYGSTPGWRWCLAAPSLGSGRRTRNGAAEHPPAPAVAAALRAPARPPARGHGFPGSHGPPGPKLTANG